MKISQTKRNQGIIQDMENGMTIAMSAKKHHISDGTVWQVRKRFKELQRTVMPQPPIDEATRSIRDFDTEITRLTKENTMLKVKLADLYLTVNP